MGVSGTAHLYYGYDLGPWEKGEGTYNEENDCFEEDGVRDDSGFDAWVAKEFGGIEPVPWDEDDDRPWSEYRDKARPFVKEWGVSVDLYASYDDEYGRYVLISESYSADQWSATRIDPAELAAVTEPPPNLVATFERLKERGLIDDEYLDAEPGWHLAMIYG